MIRIALMQEAFDAIAATLPLGSVGLRGRDQRQGRAADLAGARLGRQLGGMRGPGEDVNDTIIRLFATTEGRIVPPGG
jgi:hypothetical protein